MAEGRQNGHQDGRPIAERESGISPAAPARRFVVRTKHPWLWWWVGVLFFGGGALSVAFTAFMTRNELGLPSAGGLGFVALWAVSRLSYILRRRPNTTARG